MVTTTRLQVVASQAPRTHRRRRVGWAAVASGVVLLTAAGGSLTAVQLRTPPFVTVPGGVQRSQPTVPVNYTTTSDAEVSCQAFLEFQNLSRAQLEEVETYVESQDWSPVGQSVYDRAVARCPRDHVLPRSSPGNSVRCWTRLLPRW